MLNITTLIIPKEILWLQLAGNLDRENVAEVSLQLKLLFPTLPSSTSEHLSSIRSQSLSICLITHMNRAYWISLHRLLCKIVLPPPLPANVLYAGGCMNTAEAHSLFPVPSGATQPKHTKTPILTQLSTRLDMEPGCSDDNGHHICLYTGPACRRCTVENLNRYCVGFFLLRNDILHHSGQHSLH